MWTPSRAEAYSTSVGDGDRLRPRPAGICPRLLLGSWGPRLSRTEILGRAAPEGVYSCAALSRVSGRRVPPAGSRPRRSPGGRSQQKRGAVRRAGAVVREPDRLGLGPSAAPGQAVRSPSRQPAGRPHGRPEPPLADQDRGGRWGHCRRLGGRDSGFWAGAGWTTLQHVCCPPCGTGGRSLRRRTADTEQGEGSRAGGAFRGRGVSPMGDAGLSLHQRGRTGQSNVLISSCSGGQGGKVRGPRSRFPSAPTEA